MELEHSTCLCLLCCKLRDELTLPGETEAPQGWDVGTL